MPLLPTNDQVWRKSFSFEMPNGIKMISLACNEGIKVHGQNLTFYYDLFKELSGEKEKLCKECNNLLVKCIFS